MPLLIVKGDWRANSLLPKLIFCVKPLGGIMWARGVSFVSHRLPRRQPHTEFRVELTGSELWNRKAEMGYLELIQLEPDLELVKKIKKRIKRYVHFIGKSII